MVRGFVCYLERAATGAAIRRVRLVGPEVDHAWTAPAEDPGPAPSGAPGSTPGLLASTRAAARWVSDQLDDIRELLAVCTDTDGGLCSWLSVPSADPSVVAAALRLAPIGGGPAGADGGLSAGLGSTDSPLGAPGFGSERSIQALAVADPSSARSASLPTLTRKQPGQNVPAHGSRQRLAVLSVPDAPVRVFLDELDRLKIEVHSVVSLWHAVAAAWAPGEGAAGFRRPGAAGANGSHDGPEARVIASDSPAAAVVLIDPLGRLVWSWSSEGELIAAGSMRLHTAPQPVRSAFEPAAAPPPLDAEIPQGGAELTLTEGGARRIPPGAGDFAPDSPALECGASDIGRLVMDWLAWSAQLGQSPERIICLGPTTVPGPARPGAPTPSSLAEAVSLAWPGATVDVAINEDPIGATLNRLRGGPGAPAPAHAGRAPATDATTDPRVELVELTRRPGRVDRKLHRWAALAILAGAVATAVAGWRINSASVAARQKADDVLARRTEILQQVDRVLPGIATRPDPLGQLMGKLAQLREQRTKLQPEPPILQEAVRVLEAMQGFDDIRIAEITISSSIGKVQINLPRDDGNTGPDLLDRLKAPVGMVWKGSQGQIRADRRDYNLTSIGWAARSPAAHGNGGQP
jgi:hypothetical protein